MLIRTAAQVILALLIIPFVLEQPVHRLLESGGMTGEYSYEILLGITAVLTFLVIDRKRIQARRQRRREARAQWREREKLRNSYVLNLSPYEYEEGISGRMCWQWTESGASVCSASAMRRDTRSA